MKQLATIVFTSLVLVACKGSGDKPAEQKPAERKPVEAAPAPAPAAAAPVGFVDSPAERVDPEAPPVALAGGKATVAVVSTPGAHGQVVVRALVDGKRVDLFTTTTGDCGGGTVIEASAQGGAAVIKLGQASYSSCDDDTKGTTARDIDSHLECARLTWSDAKGAVEVERSPRAAADALPAWCRDDAPAAAAAPAAPDDGTVDVCCDTAVNGPEWRARTECEVNDWKVLDAARCPKP